MRSFVRALVAIAIVGFVVAAADPSSRETVGRVAVFAVSVAAAALLTAHVSRIGPGGQSSAFTPGRARAPGPAIPAELADLAGSFRSLAAGGRVDAQLRSALSLVAAERLQHHGLSLERPEHEPAVRALLGDELVDTLRNRATPSDPELLVAPLEVR